MTRPANPLPTWANDDDFPAGGDPWSATPTKVEPGAGKRDDGWPPEEIPQAQHMNKLLSELGLWVEHLREREVQSWNAPTIVTTARTKALVFDVAESSIPVLAGLVHSGVWYAVGFGTNVEESPYGDQWFTDTGASGLGGANLRAIGTNGARQVITAGEDTGVEHAAYIRTAGVWTKVVLSGGTSSIIDAIEYWSDNAIWVLAGQESGTSAAAIWTTTDGITFTPRTVPAPGFAGSSVEVNCVAFSPTVAVAFARDPVAGNVSESWTSADAITWVLQAPGIIDVVAVSYSALEGIFMAVTFQGRVYTSPGTDGVVWTLASFLGTTQGFGPVLVNNGSVWLASRVDAGVATPGDFGENRIKYSTDSGITWRQFNLPRSLAGISDLEFGQGKYMKVAPSGSFGYLNYSLIRVDRNEELLT